MPGEIQQITANETAGEGTDRQIPFITHANATALQVKSVESRRLSREIQRLQDELQAVEAAKAAKLAENPLHERVREIDELIDRTISDFQRAKDAREIQALAMALDRLYGTWALLTGHEKPGTRKPQRTQRRLSTDGLPTPD